MNIKHPLTKWVYKRGWNLTQFATLCGLKVKVPEEYIGGRRKIPASKARRIYELTGLKEYLRFYIEALERQRDKLLVKTLDNLSVNERMRLHAKITQISLGLAKAREEYERKNGVYNR